ncbi:hypothetical protein GX50_08917, partial [[Emmonsia] crescens]
MEPHWPTLSAARTDGASWIDKFIVDRTEDICRFVESIRGYGRCTAISRCRSGCNAILRLRWENTDARDWAIRIPIPENSVFMEEKIRNEIVMLTYLDTYTTIPIPKIYRAGTAEDNPTGLGPFIVTNWIKGRNLVKVLKERNLLAPNGFDITPEGEEILRHVYGQIAGFLLQLWTHDFDKIGAIGIDEEIEGYEVIYPPLTLYMNELVRRYGIRKTALPRQTYSHSHEYFNSLFGLQWAHVVLQKNSVKNSTDAREKFSVRAIMVHLARTFVNQRGDESPFKLFCDDFSLSNILVDENFQITGITDWGFTYAAPPQFASSCPWWLMVWSPDKIIQKVGVSQFRDAYSRQFSIFINQLKLRELERGMQDPDTLSSKMVASFVDHGGWFILACRMGAIVDDIYWKLLDNACWGRGFSRDTRMLFFSTKASDRVLFIRDREVFVEGKIRDLIEYCQLMGIPCTERYKPESLVKPHIVMVDKMTQTSLEGVNEGNENTNTIDDGDDEDINDEDTSNTLVWQPIRQPFDPILFYENRENYEIRSIGTQVGIIDDPPTPNPKQ